MQTNPCCTFFANQARGPDWVKQLQQQPDRVQWEKLSASPFSPAAVADDEVICRIAFNPIYWDDDTRRLKPTFFADATSHGASSERLAYATMRAVWRKANKMATRYNANKQRKEARSVARIAPLPVVELRRLIYEAQRGVGVYDTALENDPAHADVCVLVAGKQASRSLRASLFDISARHQLWRPVELEAIDCAKKCAVAFWRWITARSKGQ